MESMILAKLFGLLLTVTSLSVLLHYAYFSKVVDDVAHHPALFFMVSLFRLVMGALVVTFHNVWGDILGVVLTVL